MSRELEGELLDVAKWFHEHVDDVTDPMKMMEFQKKVLDHILWVLGRVAQDLQRIEGRAPKEPTHKMRTAQDIIDNKIITLDQLTRAGQRHT